MELDWEFETRVGGVYDDAEKRAIGLSNINIPRHRILNILCKISHHICLIAILEYNGLVLAAVHDFKGAST